MGRTHTQMNGFMHKHTRAHTQTHTHTYTLAECSYDVCFECKPEDAKVRAKESGGWKGEVGGQGENESGCLLEKSRLRLSEREKAFYVERAKRRTRLPSLPSFLPSSLSPSLSHYPSSSLCHSLTLWICFSLSLSLSLYPSLFLSCYFPLALSASRPGRRDIAPLPGGRRRSRERRR